MKRSARGVLLSSFSVLAFCLSHPAFAQQATNDSETVDLDTVTVTATRADRPLSDVPQTVRVIERSEIEEQLQLTNSAAAVLAKLIPGYTLPTQTISSASETFRGRDLLVMIDGVPMNTPLRDVARILPMIDLNTVERIEVVAGASSLYGSGATGGMVNFITRKPTDGKPTVSVNTAIRAFTAKPGESLAPEVSATVSGKATSGVDYLFSGSGTFANKTFDGDGRELPSDGMLGQGGGDRFGRGNFLGKVGYDFDAARRFEVSASWIYMEQDPQWMTLYQPPFARPDFGNPYNGESVLEDTKSVSARYTDSSFALGELSVLAYYNDVKKRFNYSEFDLGYNSMVYYSGNPASPTSPHNQSELYSERAGLNLTVDTPITFIEGAKLTWGSDVVHDKTWQTMTNGEDIFTPLQQTTYAAFAQLQVPIGERLVVRAGARYEYLDLSVTDYTRPAAFMGGVIPPYGPVAAILPPLNVTGGDYNYSAPTFNIGATFKLTETSEIYGGFSQGFALPDLGAFTRRAGAQTTADALAHSCGLMPYPLPGNVPVGLNPCNKSWTISYDDLGIEAQIVNNYELGLRYGFGRFRGSLAGFVSTSDQGVNFVAATNSIKQQKEIIYGVEFTGEMAVNDQLTLGTNLGWREGKWDSDGDGDIDYHLPNNRISTPFRGTVYGDYVFKTGTRFRLEGEFWSGRDEYDGTDSNPANGLTIYEIDSGATINAAISQPLGGGTLYVSVDNLLDADYANPTATATRNLPVNGWGRTVTLGFSKTF